MTEVFSLGGLSNCWLVAGGEGSILVDTGPATSRHVILQKAAEKNVRLLVLTHGHYDHIENAAFLRRELKIPVAMHRADLPLIRDKDARPLRAGSVLGSVMLFFYGRTSSAPGVEPFEPDLLVEDGQDLSEYGMDAVIRGLPGHTPGSVGLMVEGHKFFVGDAMMNFPGSDIPRLYEDREAMLESIGKIRNSPATQIFPGHGSVMRVRKPQPEQGASDDS